MYCMMVFRTTHNIICVHNSSFGCNFLIYCGDKQLRHGMIHVFGHMYGCVVKYGWYMGGTHKHAANNFRELCL
jgi:hypothetical protein